MHQDESLYYTLDPNTVGIPSLVVSGIGALYAAYLAFRLISQPNQLSDDGSDTRRDANKKIQSVGEAVHAGVRDFVHKEIHHVLVVALGFFTLICAAINWRTGIW
ncbi:hypothetical protein EON64_06910 [archaeon]|nr:MAG: hypothetical protein EON64_06910 [archaeon]